MAHSITGSKPGQCPKSVNQGSACQRMQLLPITLRELVGHKFMLGLLAGLCIILGSTQLIIERQETSRLLLRMSAHNQTAKLMLYSHASYGELISLLAERGRLVIDQLLDSRISTGRSPPRNLLRNHRLEVRTLQAKLPSLRLRIERSEHFKRSFRACDCASLR